MSFSANWGKAIWRFVKPVEVVRSVLTAVRLATTAIQRVEHVQPASAGTIATGKQFVVSAIPLSDIVEVYEQTDEHTSIRRYKVCGLPSGAVTIGKSPDGLTAMRYAQFTEVSDGYIFHTDPTIYGVVSDRGGAHCSFCVCVGAPADVSYQDLDKRFCGALDDTTVATVGNYRYTDGAINGLSGVLLAAACGATTSTTDENIVHYWSEGHDLFAVTTSGELIRSAGKVGKEPVNSVLAGGTIAPICAEYIVIDCPERHTATWLDEFEDPATLPSSVLEAFPRLRYATDMRSYMEVMESYGQYTYDSTHSPDDPGTQTLLSNYNTLAPGVHLTQRIDISVPTQLNGKITGIALICDRSKTRTAKSWDGDESLLSYTLTTGRGRCVAIISDLRKTANSIFALSLHAHYPFNYLQAGDYIKSVVLYSSEKNEDNGSILCEKEITPVTVKSGKAVAVKITFEGA